MGGPGQVSPGGFAESVDEAVAVPGPGGQDDVARFDAGQADRGEVGADAAESGCDDGDGLAGGDQFEFVFEDFDRRAVGRGAAVGARVDAPESVPGRVGEFGSRSGL